MWISTSTSFSFGSAAGMGWVPELWSSFLSRAALIAIAASLISLGVGILARLPIFFRLDDDDIRRRPKHEQHRTTQDQSLAPNDPDADAQ